MFTVRYGHAVESFSYETYDELLRRLITKIRFLYNGSYGVATDSNGLYYMRARYYNPDIKRFINQDIKVGDIGSSQSLNRYAYCEGNPVSMVDPFGLCGENANDQGSFWNNFTAHDWLGLAGIALNAAGPPGMVAAAVCDMIDAGLYFKEGETVKGVISLVCAIPGIGDVVGAFRQGTKLAKVAKVVGTTIRAAQKMYVTTASASKALDMAGDAKIEYAVKGGEMTSSVRKKILGSAALAGVSILLGKSLMKDARSFAKTASGAMPRLKTAVKEKAESLKTSGSGHMSRNRGFAINPFYRGGSKSNTPISLQQALKELDASGLRPGQTELHISQLNRALDGIQNNYNPTKAYSSVYSDGNNRYLVEGHHTTVAFKMLGKENAINMNTATNDMPLATNVYWTKKWYQFWRETIKIVED